MKALIFSVILFASYVGAQDSNKPMQIPPAKICFTQWFDRDNPGGNGDYETLSDLRMKYPNKICSKPLSIEAVTLTGISAGSTGQVFQAYNTAVGFACVNSQQNNGQLCLDYKVRFGCSCPWPI